MMKIMLLVMGAYLVGCYAYGLYLLAKVYTGRRNRRRAIASGTQGLTLHASSQDSGNGFAVTTADTVAPQPDHAQAA